MLLSQRVSGDRQLSIVLPDAAPTAESGEPFPPGFCHFPQLGEEFFRQLTAEQLITRLVKGYRKAEWQKTRERNQALDTRIYARAAASHFGIDRFQEQHGAALEKQMSIRATAALPQPAGHSGSGTGQTGTQRAVCGPIQP
jgi:phage terminase large subunit GpA-like protein